MSTAALSPGASERLLLTIRQVADATGLCEKTIWAQTFPRGPLIPCRVGRSLRYSPDAVREWIEQQTVRQSIPRTNG
jgi:predicted DNA-binding transcriptional regulator AlpA